MSIRTILTVMSSLVIGRVSALNNHFAFSQCLGTRGHVQASEISLSHRLETIVTRRQILQLINLWLTTLLSIVRFKGANL